MHNAFAMVVPGKEEFLTRTAGGKRMPIYRDLLADVETPLSAYWKLSHDQPYSFLLESVTGGENLARYSMLGFSNDPLLRTKGRSAVPAGQDPLDMLAERLKGPEVVKVNGMPVFIGGAVGMLGYDIVRFFERLPDSCKDDLGVDDLAMMMVDTVVVFDHARNSMRIISVAEGTDEGYEKALEQIEAIRKRLLAPRPDLPDQVPATDEPTEVSCNVTQDQYEDSVRRVVEYIAAGDGVQMVPSLRLSTDVKAHPLTVYRALRSLNPSPYMFLVRFGDYDLVGASPEILVSLHGQTARVRPIAGTRKRGATPEEDTALATELLGDEKERAEHVMLVDLGRNDLGRVCDFGSVKVTELMVVEKYSHVMHIVSDVTGTLQADKDVYDLIRATFPAGTVSGAPKVRAMSIIDELETTRRGSYAGGVGFFSHSGEMDLCIALRTILLKDGKAYVQAGAGVVYDSVPTKEYEECLNKARACLKAIEIAHQGL